MFFNKDVEIKAKIKNTNKRRASSIIGYNFKRITHKYK